MVEYFKKSYEKIQNEDLDEKLKESLFKITLLQSNEILEYIKDSIKDNKSK